MYVVGVNFEDLVNITILCSDHPTSLSSTKITQFFVNTFFYVNVFKSTPKNVTRLHLLLGCWIFCHHISWSDMCCKVAVLWGNNYQLSLLHYLFLWFLCNMCLPKYMTYHLISPSSFPYPISVVISSVVASHLFQPPTRVRSNTLDMRAFRKFLQVKVWVLVTLT